MQFLFMRVKNMRKTTLLAIFIIAAMAGTFAHADVPAPILPVSEFMNIEVPIELAEAPIVLPAPEEVQIGQLVPQESDIVVILPAEQDVTFIGSQLDLSQNSVDTVYEFEQEFNPLPMFLYDNSINPVPEPGSIITLAAGSGLLALRFRRRAGKS